MKSFFLMLSFLLCITSYTEAVELMQAKKTTTVFIQNKGQWDSNILFMTKIKGMNAWVTKQGIRYDFHTLELKTQNKSPRALTKFSEPPSGIIHGHVVDMECVGGNISTDSPNGLEKSYYNYILGDDKSKWAGYVPVFNEVIRHNVYNGIDQRLYFEGSYMRYDFIVAPNSNFSDIVLKYNGAKGLTINDNGELVLQTSIGDIVQQKLYAYQIVGTEKKQISCSFVSKSNGNVGFNVDSYDKSKPLIIDPLLYSTFIGGGDIDEGNDVMLDYENNVIVVGTTQSINMPTHVGSYEMNNKGLRDVYVAKFNSDLSDLIFCTYYGGDRDDFAFAGAIDNAGNVIFGGKTFSHTLPHTNVEFNNTYSGSGMDGFVAKISATGSNLGYGNYMGGTGDDQVNDIVIVPLINEVVVVGSTQSPGFPTTPGAYRRTYAKASGFISRINESGSGLVFSTFFGADSITVSCTAVALDRNNSPIVVGNTSPANFSVIPGVFKYPKIHFPASGSAIRSKNTAPDDNMKNDGFLIKLGASGITLDYATLLGGTGNDECYGVDVSLQGVAAVCGSTESNTDFKPTPSGFDQTFGSLGTIEGFAMCIGTSGGVYYSTYLGGSDEDIPTCAKFYDNNGSAVFGGYTFSGDFPTGKVNDYAFHGGYDGFLTQLSGNGSICQYSTFVGGGSSDKVYGMVLSNTGNVYVTGSTQSVDLSLSANAKYKSFNGQNDGFISSFSTCSVTLQSPRDTLICPGKPLTITNNATGTGNLRYNWMDFASGVNIGTQNSITVAPLEQSIYILSVTDDNCTKTVTYIVKTKPLPTISTVEEKKTCIGTSLKLSATAAPTSTIAWYDAIDAATPIGAGNSFTTPALTKSVNYFVESMDTSTKCTSERKKIQITVVPPPTPPTSDENIKLCANNSITLSALFPSDVDFRWYDSLTNGRLIQVGRNFTTPRLNTTTTYYLESLDTTTNCISIKRTPVTVTILPTPAPVIQGQNAACLNSSGLIYSVESKPKQEYIWSINANGSITAGQGTNKVTVTWSGLGVGILTLKQKDITSNCIKDTSFAVNISNQLSLTLTETGSRNLCTGDSVILDPGTGYSSYKWSSGETSQTITVKTAGDYSVDVQDASGCKGSSNKVSVTVNTKPTPMIVGKNATCVNGSPVQYSVTPVAVNSCKWEVSAEGTIVSGQDSPTIMVNWTGAGNGTVKVVESSSFCSTENVLPVVISTSLVPLVTASGKTTLCEGESVDLDAGKYSTFKWSNGETTQSITVKTAGSYTVEVTDAGGCKGTSEPKTVTVSPNPNPTITSSGKTDICEGDSVTLDAGAFSTYLWSTGASTQKITVKTAGKYSVTVTNASGCKGTSPEQTVTVNPLPNTVTISQTGDDSLVVNPYDNNNIYKWKLDGTDIGRITQTVQVSTEGNYTVEVTNPNGCKTTSIPFPYLKPNSAVLTVSVSPLVIEATAGETVKIPLVITSSKNLTQATASSFTAEISVEPSLLVPSTGTSTIVNGRRIVSVNGTRKDGNDTLAVVEMQAALGSVETSSILVKSFEFTGGKAQVTTKDGEFHLSGICRDGGVRLFKPAAQLSLSMQPNPATEVLNVTVTASEIGQHTIALTNTLGEKIAILYKGSLSGTQEISSSLNDIPAGVYFVVLNSPSQMIVQRILISK